MAKVEERYQPSFSLFPLNNDRTGYQPVNLPVVLVVPFKRTADGTPVGDADVQEIIFYIEDAPGRSKVAGFQNRGILIPSLERFRVTIDQLQLSDVKIDVPAQSFFDQDTGELIDFEDAKQEDLFTIGLLRGQSGAFGQFLNGPIDSLPYYQDADYYDLSTFIIETYDLPPGRYRFVWQCRFYKRVLSADGEVICIDTSKLVATKIAVNINHPGEIHQMMIRNTPALYFNGPRIDKDSTIAFYRPFADALQDLFDEQELLRGINWIDKIPAQYIPYLSYLIGFDLPYFKSSTDNIRKALLRNGRRLQQLKGSRRAIRELFEIFGFTIDLANLWYSKDGNRFIAPNEVLPSDISDQSITTTDVCYTEPLLSDYQTDGFGQIEVPLLFRPLDNITIDAYLVEKGSDAETTLAGIVSTLSDDVEALSSELCQISIDGFQTNSNFGPITDETLGISSILISQDSGTIDALQLGSEPTFNVRGVSYDFDRNIIKLTFDHYLEFDDKVLYVFATYSKRNIVLPDALKDLRSNRFDINVLTFKDGTVPDSDVFDFLIEFLFKFKAFHSLLRKIIFPVEYGDIYNVQDFCFGGQHAQSPNTDLGELQTYPPIIPLGATDASCLDQSNRGFKNSDLILRNRVRQLLEEEHNVWKNLDNTHVVPPEFQSLSRIPISQQDSGDCQFTQLGQDRIISTGNKDFDHTEDNRSKVCDLESNTLDYCYKGRVQQDLSLETALQFNEIFRCKPCGLSGGVGYYYLTQLINDNEFSGGDGTSAADLRDVSNINRSIHDRNYTRIMGFPHAEIHYSDRSFLGNLDDAINNRFFATNRPSLEVEKDNLHIPGHRFISMANIENNLNHPNYFFRPWDDLLNIPCPEDIPDNVIIPDLNATLELDTNGDELLLFDEVQLVYYGNGIEADIPSMDDHSLSTVNGNYIAHSIWSSGDVGLTWTVDNVKYYSVDQSEDGIRYPIEALSQDKDSICFNDLMDPIFNSAHRTCPCSDASENVWSALSLDDYSASGATLESGVGLDYIDGYPAEFGPYNVSLEDYDFTREIDDTVGSEQLDYSEAIGIPSTNPSEISLRFKIGSGIRLETSSVDYHYYRPYRLDCDCVNYTCDATSGATITVSDPEDFGVMGFGYADFGGSSRLIETEEAITVQRCSQDFYLEPDGSYDFNCDKLVIEPILIFDESYGAKSCIMDGSIPNMMSFDESKSVFENPIDSLPSEGSFRFIDSYGIIYSGMFETFDDRIDNTIEVRDPRVPGSEQSGAVINRKVYRDGIITIERQILQSLDSGFMIIAEGYTQEVSRFQTTFGCGDDEYDDPFAYHLDFDIVDDVEFDIVSLTTDGTTGGTTDVTAGSD